MVYRKFSLVFVGGIEADFDPWEKHFHVFREMDGEVLDYDVFVTFRVEGGYLNETEDIEGTGLPSKIVVREDGLEISKSSNELIFNRIS